MSEVVGDAFGDTPAVCIDFKNPKAYLALSGTFALEDELGIAFDWLPLHVAPLTKPSVARPDDDRGTRHRRARGLYNDMDLRRYARVQGLALADMYRNPDASVAGIGLLWTKWRSPGALRAYVRTVFDRYWSARLDLADPAAIGGVLRELGIERNGWDAYAGGAGREALAATLAELREAGLFDVPAYVIERQIFYGRQHLPMIRWLLSGRHGAAPA